MFIAGRGWLDEVPNDPGFCDLAQVTGMSMDGLDFEQVLRLIESAKERAQWIVLAGHEIGTAGQQTTRVGMLETLLQYLRDPANKCWIAPIGTVAKYIQRQRSAVGK